MVVHRGAAPTDRRDMRRCRNSIRLRLTGRKQTFGMKIRLAERLVVVIISSCCCCCCGSDGSLAAMADVIYCFCAAGNERPPTIRLVADT